MKKNLSNIILIIVFIIGLSLLLYPTFSDYWNTFHQTIAIAEYAETIANMDEEQYEKMWQDAEDYNETLQNNNRRWKMTEKEREHYKSLMDVSGTGMMGYIEIPAIDCELPVYHGVEEKTLQVAVGHIEGSSLPVGGLGTHCVLSGHRGLPSAKLFSDLDELVEGDTFLLQMLDKTLTYEVDKISIVVPRDWDELQIVKGKDYCTLVTCTPYGVNSHRLLIRGHRVENQKGAEDIRVTADALQIDPVIVAPVVALPILLFLLGFILVQSKKKRN